MKNFIIKSLEIIVYIIMAFIFIGGTIWGAAAGGALGLLGGLVISFLYAVLVGGMFLILISLRDTLTEIKEKLSQK